VEYWNAGGKEKAPLSRSIIQKSFIPTFLS